MRRVRVERVATATDDVETGDIYLDSRELITARVNIDRISLLI